MKLKVKLEHETRTIEHVLDLVISPDENDNIGDLNIEFESADEGGQVVHITEGGIDGD